MRTDPRFPRVPMGGVACPAALAFFDPLPIGPAQQGQVQVAPGETPDVAHQRCALAFAGLHLVGDEDHLRDERHRRRTEGVVTHGVQHVVVGHGETLAQDDGGKGTVQQDRVGFVDGIEGKAGIAGEPELLRRGVGAEEVVPPGSKLDAIGIEIPANGEIACLHQNALDVAQEASGTRRELAADEVDLLLEGCGHYPSGPSLRPPRRWRCRWWMVMPAWSPTLKATR